MKFLLWLLLGLALGPSLLEVTPPSILGRMASLAGGLFLFCAGWEMRFLNLRQDAGFYLKLFIGSFVIPALAGWFFFQGNLFMAMAMAISALPVVVQLLKERGLYQTVLGRRTITLASLCDLGAWVALAFLLPPNSVVAWITSHWIVIAFFVGILMGRVIPCPQNVAFRNLQMWVLAPLFFVGLGWQVDLISLFDLEVFAKVFTVAVIAKSLGTYAFSRWAGESHKESWKLAALLNARGAMEILAAHFAFEAGLINGALFSALILLGVFTAAMAVPLVKK